MKVTKLNGSLVKSGPISQDQFDSMKLALSWLSGKLRYGLGSRAEIDAEIEISFLDELWQWGIRKGRKNSLSELQIVADCILENAPQLYPVLAYFDLNEPLKVSFRSGDKELSFGIRKKPSSLNEFWPWLRLQDDLKNETLRDEGVAKSDELDLIVRFFNQLQSANLLELVFKRKPNDPGFEQEVDLFFVDSEGIHNFDFFSEKFKRYLTVVGSIAARLGINRDAKGIVLLANASSPTSNYLVCLLVTVFPNIQFFWTEA